MRKVMLQAICAAAFASFACTGCSLPGEKARMGWTFIAHKPPVVNTEMPVLVQHQTGDITGQPLGTVAGPVNAGQWLHGKGNVPLMMGQVPGVRADMVYGGCQQPVNQQLMTCEQWCQIMRAAQAQRMPGANQ